MSKQLENTEVVLREIDTNSGETIQERECSAVGIAYVLLLEFEYEYRQVGMSCPWRMIVRDDTHEWDITNIQARER